MYNLKRYIFLLLLLVSSTCVLAQPYFKASVNKENVPLNQSLTVEFSMNEDGDYFKAPNFEGFKIVSGPNQSVSVSWINGKKSFNKTYSFQLQPTRKGKITIGSASIDIKGEVYNTQTITVNITDAVKVDSRANNLNSIQTQSLETIHLVAEISNRNPYINEPVTISYKIYFREGLSGYAGKKIPTFDKFWTHNVKVPEPQPIETTYKGEPYYSILIKQDVLMAQEVGDFTIDPLVLEVQAQVLTGRRDFFGFPEYGYIEKEFSTNTVKITAKALPEEGKPVDFSGAVGSFDFKAVPSKTQLKAGEMLNLKVEVSGRGNLNLLKMPTPKANSALEIYDPIYSEKLNTGIYGIQGNRKNDYTIIPQYQGDYSIEPMHFSYFDLNTKSYKTISTDSITINVLEGPTLPTNKELQGDVLENEQELFQPIKESMSRITPYKSTYWSSTLFYVLNAAALVAILLVVGIVETRKNATKDILGNKLKANNKLARKYLSQAKKHLKDKDLFYEALELCLHNFLKAKLNIETTQMSNDNIKELLMEKQVEDSSIQSFIDLKNACEWARYTPSDKVDSNKDYQTAINIIAELEKQIK